MSDEHISLLTDEDKQEATSEKSVVFRGELQQRRSGMSTRWALFLCLVCTLINAAHFHYARDTRVRTYEDLKLLRRPNHFIGLENTTQVIHPRRVHPQVLSIISEAHPNTAYPDDPVMYMNRDSFWPPQERIFQVSSGVSTISEFFTVDYKLEQCELALRMPPPTAASHLNLGQSSNVIDIWVLDASVPIRAKELTWNSRPKRLEKIGSAVEIGYSVDHRIKFHCPMDSLLAFEFIAATPDTAIQFSQNFTGAPPRLDIFEYTT